MTITTESVQKYAEGLKADLTKARTQRAGRTNPQRSRGSNQGS